MIVKTILIIILYYLKLGMPIQIFGILRAVPGYRFGTEIFRLSSLFKTHIFIFFFAMKYSTLNFFVIISWIYESVFDQKVITIFDIFYYQCFIFWISGYQCFHVCALSLETKERLCSNVYLFLFIRCNQNPKPESGFNIRIIRQARRFSVG